MGPPSYMRSVVDRNVVMRRIPVYSVTKTLLRYSVPTEKRSKLDEQFHVE
jgi:hypothetical protein